MAGKAVVGATKALGGLFKGKSKGTASTIAEQAGDLIADALERREMKLQANYNTRAIPVKDYQYQEGVVRRAVNSLMADAPRPDHETGFSASYELKEGKKAAKGLNNTQKNDFVNGLADFNSGDYDAAITSWERIGDSSNAAVKYNLGIAYLMKTSRLSASNPGAAYESAEKAKQALRQSSGTYRNKEEALYSGTDRLVKGLEQFQGISAPVQVAQSASTASSAPSSVPAPSRAGSKHAVLIGVGEYEDSRIPGLSAAAADVALMKRALLAAGFPAKNITTLVNEEATKQAMQTAIIGLGKKVDENSLVVIAISTHGTDPRDFDGPAAESFIVCYDTNIDAFSFSGYSVIEFRNQVDRWLPCRQKIIFQDTCHSGSGSMRMTSMEIKAMEWPDYMAVFAASGESESSLETDGNGIFTKSLADIIQREKGRVTVAQINEHLANTVPQQATELGYRQNPKLYLGAGAQDIRLN
jgi:hypothetical protein